MLDALIFDFDGVVVDSEPLHLKYFAQVLAKVDIALTTEQYFSRYLGFDDHDCFAAVFADNGRQISEAQIAELTAAKSILIKKAYGESIQPLAGSVELIKSASAAQLPLAICSGGLGEEIRLAGSRIGVLDCFATIVPADEVTRGKPDPQGYELALARLIEITGKPLTSANCVVLEDSPAGIAAGKAAGMKVLAVTSSYQAQMLSQADRIVNSMTEVSLAMLEGLL